VAFYRRKMLDETKEGASFFDPFFRMFFEDLDLSWRAHNRGWKAYYIPSAIACHARGGSVRNESGQGKALARRYLSNEFHSDLIKNRYRAILKNETFGAFCFHLIPIVLYDLCAWFYVLFFRPKVIKIFFSNAKELSGANEKRFDKNGREAVRTGCGRASLKQDKALFNSTIQEYNHTFIHKDMADRKEP
jgi:GT2 family glycosyltransferase